MSILFEGNTLHVMAVVHARGGSKRIPGKNILPLCGKPLMGYCLEAAGKSKYIDVLIVSSDSEDIKRVAREFGAETPFTRPADISEDVASELVTLHALDFMEQRDGRVYDIVVTMQPTTPFLRTEDIDASIEKLLATPHAETVMTATKMSQLPTWARRIREDGISYNIMGRVSKGDHGISQTHPDFFIANGGAYATRRSLLKEQEMIIGPNTALHIMPQELSIDIDEPLEFFFAEKLQELMLSGTTVRDHVMGKAAK
ncbi:MAG: hypothetical protein AB7E47_04140 [Desulfovibrionaceae bacterium]